MHQSVLDFLRESLAEDEVRSKHVVEVGSQNVNGTPRTVILPLRPAQYIGADFAPGKGVDIVVDAAKLCSKFGESSFDIVICTEMLEHVQDWRLPVQQMKDLLRPQGLLLVTTRSPGFKYHPYPIDVWRYTQDDARGIFSDMEILVLKDDPQAPGIFLKARKPSPYKSCDLTVIEVHPQSADHS
jgi:SAM-dependent methyltransferase